MFQAPLLARRLALFTFVLLPACGGEDPSTVATATPGANFRRNYERCELEAVVEFRKSLDLRERDRAQRLRVQLDPRLDEWVGVEKLLFDARLNAMDGNEVEAVQYLEAARKQAPRDPRVFATGAELHAAFGRMETAAEEIAAGNKIAPQAPELLRAQGVYSICTSGGMEVGLKRLEEAKRLDSKLPFCDRPLGQAHLLCGKRAMAADNGLAALTHAKRSLQFDPAEVDAWHFYSQTLAAVGEFEEAIQVLEKLGEEGEPVEGELAGLHKRAGLLALLENDRPKALGHFVLARESGLSGKDLGSGAEMLLDEAHAEYSRAVEFWDAGASDDARAALNLALSYDPSHVAAHNLLAVLLYAENDPSGAAGKWREVIVLAEEHGVILPDPVHEHLARALWQSGDREGARLALEEYLITTPNGEWASSTRELLEKIPAD